MRIFWQVAQEQTLQQRSSESSLHAEVTMQNPIVTAMHTKTLDVTRQQLTVYAINITPEINASFISIRICYRRHEKLAKEGSISIQVWPITSHKMVAVSSSRR